MKDTVKKVIIACVVVGAIAAVFIVRGMLAENDFHSKYAGQDLMTDVAGTGREGTYTIYINDHQAAGAPKEDIEVAVTDYTDGTDVEVLAEYEGEKDVLYTGLESEVTWNLNVPTSGLYNIFIEYMTVESRGVPAERSVLINGELPFSDAGNILFTRIWKDNGEPRVDNQGNEIRPTQVEEYFWQSAYCRDDMGYITEPYQFYFEQGDNTLTFKAVNEPLILKRLVVKAIESEPTYAEYIAEKSKNSEIGGVTYLQKVQGESSTYRSESSLYAKYDRASATTQPYSVKNTLLNYVGGDAWRSSGQWIEWNVDVPENGFYNISIKGRQNYDRGSVSSRVLTIDGEIPFEEVKEVSFDYSNDWQVKTLSDDAGTPYRFFLTKGTHTLRLTATLGSIGSILEQLEDSTYRLNQIYRRILIYTGPNPDKYRDYNIGTTYPEIMKAMDLESKRLYKIVDDTVAYTGQKADKIATAQTLAQQLERFCEKPDRITLEFTSFKDNITALGTAALSMSETKLDIDYLVVSGENVRPEKDKANALDKVMHELRSFNASFVVDYDAVGDVYDDDAGDVVKVWILTGRDQGTILKSMVDDTFTPNTGVKVNVEIVAPDALLNAVVAGRGPNVVLSVGADQPVNYALRNAVEDLTQFPDCKEVMKDFTPSSYEQYRLDEHIYGMPETQTFNVMFYRTDVLEELELPVPQTWQELIEELPTIQGNNLSVGIPTAAGSSTTSTPSTAVASNVPDLSLYFTLLFQYGGDMYNEAGTKTTVDNEAGVKACDDYIKYFNDYGIPTIYDFVSRFRSGEMPIGIAAYSTYNTLMVSAPEIRGLWDFTLIPGTEYTNPDGTTYIDRSDFITGSASMMIKTDDDSIRNASWEFMKWWASKDTQVRFGREIEALLGSSARYATANKEAFSQLAWSSDDIAVLNEQWEQTRGIREVPGGYYTGRHITNAIRKVINDKDDARETIIDYSIKIDEEITKKRREFGLPIYQAE